MRHQLILATPEKVTVSYRLASASSRSIAKLLDGVILVAILIAIANIAAAVEFLAPILTILSVFGVFLYFVVLEAVWNGQTVGKAAVGIRVRQIDGTPIKVSSAILRNIMLIADFLPGSFVGGLTSMLLSPKSQRLGDLAAGTVVIHERRGAPIFRVRTLYSYHNPAAPVPFENPFLPTVGTLPAMTHSEFLVLERLVTRFPMLPSTAQERFVQEIWEPFAQQHSIPRLEGVHPYYLMHAVVTAYAKTRGHA